MSPAKCRHRNTAINRRLPAAYQYPSGCLAGFCSGAGVVAVGADQDLHVRPVGADPPRKLAEEGPDLARSVFWRALAGRDEPAVGIEDDDRLEAVAVMAGVKKPSLGACNAGVGSVTIVERDPNSGSKSPSGSPPASTVRVNGKHLVERAENGLLEN